MEPRLLRTLDIFSGIGGLTRALHGYAEPVAYCDVWQASRDVLGALMQKGLLPKAPICDDVQKLSLDWVRENVDDDVNIDMIVGGFPCVGFSTAGSRKGFENSQSSLFKEVIRLVDEFAPPYILLENVQNILTIGMGEVVSQMRARGYNLRWCCLPAWVVGSPQRRARWICLCNREDAEVSSNILLAGGNDSEALFEWDYQRVPVTMTVARCRQHAKRLGLLGNSVVPDCIRYGYKWLVNGGDDQIGRTTTPMRDGQKWPHAGYVDYRGSFKIKGPVLPPPPDLGLCVDPDLYVAPKPPKIKLPRLTGTLTKPMWPTPRHCTCTGCHTLTQRNAHDIETFVRFERNTPNELRGGVIAPEFVEWLMGFPEGWTLATTSNNEM